MDGLNYNPFIVQRPQQRQQQPQISPAQIAQGLDIAKQFGAFGGVGGSGAGIATGSQAAGNIAAAQGIGSAGTIGGGGWGAAGGAGGLGSAAAAAGPWAALAAIIYANESYARNHGYRADDPKEHAKDILTSDVFYQDVEKRWLPNIGIEEGSKESKALSSTLHPMPIDLGKQLEGLKAFKDILF